MIYDILEQKITTSWADLTPGVSLFRHMLPSECDFGVMTRGPSAGVVIDEYIPGWYKTDIQVVTRHTDPVKGYNLASQIARALKVEAEEVYPPSEERDRTVIKVFQAKTLPIQFPRLEGNGYEFSQHFLACFSFESIDRNL